MPKPPNVEEIERDWASERWRGIERPYNAKDIEKLRGTKICGDELLPRHRREYRRNPPFYGSTCRIDGRRTIRGSAPNLVVVCQGLTLRRRPIS